MIKNYIKEYVRGLYYQIMKISTLYMSVIYITLFEAEGMIL